MRKHYLVDMPFLAAKAFALNAIFISSAFLTATGSSVFFVASFSVVVLSAFFVGLFSTILVSSFGRGVAIFFLSRFLVLTTTAGFFSFLAFFSSRGLLISLPSTSVQDTKEMTRAAT